LSKTAYDRLGRAVRRYTLASTNDTTYADALTVTGDIVMEEHLTGHDPDTGHVVRTVGFQPMAVCASTVATIDRRRTTA